MQTTNRKNWSLNHSIVINGQMGFSEQQENEGKNGQQNNKRINMVNINMNKQHQNYQLYKIKSNKFQKTYQQKYQQKYLNYNKNNLTLHHNYPHSIVSNNHHSKVSHNHHSIVSHNNNNMNITKQRSRKQRLIEQRNLQIEKSNRILLERIRKIKMKNMYVGKEGTQLQKIDNQGNIKSNSHNYLFSQRKLTLLQQNYQNIYSRLPQISSINNNNNNPIITKSTLKSISSTIKSSSNIIKQSSNIIKQPFSNIKSPSTLSQLSSTRSSHLHKILHNPSQFIEQYFTDLHEQKNKTLEQQQLGNFIDIKNGWKIKVLLLGGQRLILSGKRIKNKKQEELVKKYLYDKVKHKIQNEAGLEKWVIAKYQIQK